MTNVDFPLQLSRSSESVSLPRSAFNVKVTMKPVLAGLRYPAYQMRGIAARHHDDLLFWVDGSTEPICGETLERWLDWEVHAGYWEDEVKIADRPIDWTDYIGPCGCDDAINEAWEEHRRHTRAMFCLDAAIARDKETMTRAIALACKMSDRISTIHTSDIPDQLLWKTCVSIGYDGIPE